MDFPTLMMRIMNFLAVAIFFLCTGLFVVGAFILTTSGGGERVQWGRDIMVGAVIGLVTVLSSYAALRTVMYFLYIK